MKIPLSFSDPLLSERLTRSPGKSPGGKLAGGLHILLVTPSPSRTRKYRHCKVTAKKITPCGAVWLLAAELCGHRQRATRLSVECRRDLTL